HFHKSRSDVSRDPMDRGLFGFWFRFASVTGFFEPAPSPKPRQNPKILAAHRYIFSVNAPAGMIGDSQKTQNPGPKDCLPSVGCLWNNSRARPGLVRAR